MNFIKLVINLIKKDYNKIDKQGALLFFVKFFVHIVFNRQLRNIRKKALTKFRIPKKITFTQKINLENSFLISSHSGLYLKNDNQILPILENCGGFFGIDYFDNKYFAACFGSGGHTRGCLVSFKISNKALYDFKIVFKKRFQYFHGLKIHLNYLYLCDSSWLLNHTYIHKFEITGNEIKKISSKEIKFDDVTQKEFLNYCHVNTIKIFENKIYLLFHNMTKYTNIPSKVLIFDKDLKYLSKLNFVDNLQSAHDFEINEKYKSILDSDNSIFYCNKEFIKIEDYFLRGFYDDKESFYIGLSTKKDQTNPKSIAGIAKINKNPFKLDKIENVNLNGITSILKINNIV